MELGHVENAAGPEKMGDDFRPNDSGRAAREGRRKR